MAPNGRHRKGTNVMTWVPQACTLPTAEQPLRVAEFDELFATAVRPARRTDPILLTLGLPGDAALVATAQDLIARETACCLFFTFTLRASATGVELDVQVPAGQVAVLDAVQAHADAVLAASAAGAAPG